MPSTPQRQSVKKGIDANDSRRRRESQAMTLRKNKREESLQKRRNFGAADASTVANPEPNQQLNDMPENVQKIHSSDFPTQLDGITYFRKLLSIEKNPPIDQVISAGVLPRMVEMLHAVQESKIQFESCWALTNIASGNSPQTQAVVESGAVPIFVQLLNSEHSDIREQAIWALGNIAGDSPRCRDLILEAGAVQPLLNQFHDSTKLSLIRNASWTVSNLCRGKPQPELGIVQPFLSVLARLIYSTDSEVLTDSTWALSYISDGSDQNIQAVIDSGVCSRLIELLSHESPSVQTPALRTVGNIVTGNASHTQVIIDLNGLPGIVALLNSPKKGIVKEACWAISNITAGTENQIQAVLNTNVIPPLIHLLAHADFDIKKEATWAISNATSGGSIEHVKYLVNQGCIKPLCDLLISTETNFLLVVLEAVENILKLGQKLTKSTADGENPYAVFVEEAEGLDKIEALQSHENDKLYQKAVHILEQYYGAEDEEDENLAPNVNNNQAFSFAATNNSGFAF